MEVGSCFKNYTDFSERFAAYKKESRLQFGLKSCVSVRFHNRQNGTHIREDITFMQVKFGCVRSREHAKKKKKQQEQEEEEEEEPQLCPAYLVLQYSEELDQLVITELNCNHIHAEPKGPSIGSDRSPLARLAARMAASRACGVPPAKLRKEDPAEVETVLSVKVEADSEASMNIETDAEKRSPPSLSPSREPEAAQAGADNNTSSPLVHIDEVMRNFLRVDAGSLASLTMGGSSSQALERLSFQTSKMKGLFLRFPESLLLHRVLGCGGHTLYAFLVESKDRVGKLVHFAVLKDDTPENVREMLSVFKKFNQEEEGRKVKVVLVDVAFLHREVLRELFPSAQVLLSVYHTVRLLERKLKKSRASLPFKNTLKAALREAVFSPSKASLEALSLMVKDLVDPGLYEHLQAHWFSCEMLWYFHAKKGLHACSTYIDSLELITQKLSSLFSPQLSLETSVLRFVESANDFNTKGLENLNQAFSNGGEGGRSILMEERKIQTRASLKRRSSAASRPPKRFPAKASVETPKQGPRHSPAKPMANMLAALQETCTDLAYQLCLTEWDVVQKSTQLVTSCTRNKATVQLLEDTHQVGRGGQRCSCYFHCRYQLPCRHILAVLLANQQVVEEAMVAKRWQRKYQHLSASQENVPEWTGAPKGSPSASPAAAPKERQDMIQSLSKELGNLLLQSEGEELEERSATLRMIVNIWTQCSELREEEEAPAKPLNVRNVGDLPFLWVKKEEMEEVEISSVTPGASLGANQTPVA